MPMKAIAGWGGGRKWKATRTSVAEQGVCEVDQRDLEHQPGHHAGLEPHSPPAHTRLRRVQQPLLLIRAMAEAEVPDKRPEARHVVQDVLVRVDCSPVAGVLAAAAVGERSRPEGGDVGCLHETRASLVSS